IWPWISGPLGTEVFEDPVTGRTYPGLASRKDAIPDITDRLLPALRLAPTYDERVTAADNDGDGVADGAMFRLNPGQLYGLTWYGSVRVIDNSGAINAAVAWKTESHDQYIGDDHNFWPTSIGLRELLAAQIGQQAADRQMARLQSFRAND